MYFTLFQNLLIMSWIQNTRKHSLSDRVQSSDLMCPLRGKPIPTYKWTKDGCDISHRVMIACSEDLAELVVKEAQREDSGTYKLLLENKCGKKELHIKVKVTGFPDTPQGPLEFSDIHAHSVRVSWKAPLNDGGSEILGYIVERRKVTKAAWYTVDSRVTETSLVVKGLRENVEYHFKVTAKNHVGMSKTLKSDNPVTPRTLRCEYIFQGSDLHVICIPVTEIT